MIFKKLNLFILIFHFIVPVSSGADCQRKVSIGNKIIYIDTPDGKKGEGLRKYLEKDPNAIKLLNTYQKNLTIKNTSKVAGSIATVGLIGGFAYQGNKSKQNNILLISGITAILNFLVSSTLQFYNEENLQNAIRAYNKNDFPKIKMNLTVNSSEKNQLALIGQWSF